MPTAALVVLALDAAAPAPVSATFFVPNGRSTVRTLRHPDQFNTLYLELRFPVGALASLNGQPLTADDSVEVTVQPLAGGYGFTLSPSGLTFSANPPTALFSFGRYADPAAGLAVFPDREAYLAALDLWREVGVDQWATAPGSGPVGVDEVRATVGAPGRFRLAAVAP
ncbi:MAG: hypothetical protein OEY20_01695 [Gemmatimonadota bacterium]|nr:hypothetical protein [Gemmatimonadota bacterium]